MGASAMKVKLVYINNAIVIIIIADLGNKFSPFCSLKTLPHDMT